MNRSAGACFWQKFVFEKVKTKYDTQRLDLQCCALLGYLTNRSLLGTAAYKSGSKIMNSNVANKAVIVETSVMFRTSPHKKDRAVLRLFSSIMDAIDNRRRDKMRIPLLPLMPKLRWFGAHEREFTRPVWRGKCRSL